MVNTAYIYGKPLPKTTPLESQHLIQLEHTSTLWSGGVRKKFTGVMAELLQGC